MTSGFSFLPELSPEDVDGGSGVQKKQGKARCMQAQ
jgi:hypothetical protein